MIQYRDATKVFGTGAEKVTAVKDIAMDIAKGDLVSFLGPSGCGKTTLLRLTNRLLTLTGGEIRINGQDIMTWDKVKLRQSMGYAIQEVGLFPNKTIAENIAVVPRLLGWKKGRINERVDELLDILRLEPDVYRDRYPSELSGGQQQRVGVARCLAADPEILLMDEPFGAIDPINREEIQDEFLNIQSRLKKTVVFVTHDIHEAIKMGDRIAIFQEGKLIQYDTPEVMLTNPVNQYIADFVGADRAIKILGLYKAYEAMKKKPEQAVPGSMSTLEVLNRFDREDLINMVITDEGKPVGYIDPISIDDENTEIKNIGLDYPVLIHMHDRLNEVMSHMLMHDIRHLPVIDDNGILVGTISHEDVRRCILKTYDDTE